MVEVVAVSQERFNAILMDIPMMYQIQDRRLFERGIENIFEMVSEQQGNHLSPTGKLFAVIHEHQKQEIERMING